MHPTESRCLFCGEVFTTTSGDLVVEDRFVIPVGPCCETLADRVATDGAIETKYDATLAT